MKGNACNLRLQRLLQLQWKLLENQTSLYSNRQPQVMSKWLGFGGSTSTQFYPHCNDHRSLECCGKEWKNMKHDDICQYSG